MERRHDAMASVLALAAHQHGVVARWQALEAGMSSSAIDRRRATAWRSVHRGVYLAMPNSRTDRTPLAAATVGLGSVGLAAGASAGWLHEFKGVSRPSAPEVLTTTRDRPRLDGVIVRTSCHPDHGSAVVDGIPVTGPARTVVDLAPRMTEDVLIETVADLVRRRMTTTGRVLSVVNALGRPPGAVAVREAVAHLERRHVTDSTLEDELLGLIRDAGLPEPKIGWEVHGRDGRTIARLDLAYPELGIAIEVDGLRFHATPAEKRYDDRRQNALVISGWLVLRFSAVDIRRHPAAVAATIARAIEERSGRRVTARG